MTALAPVAVAVARFLRWWVGELRACLPARLREALARKVQTLAVVVGEDEARFLLRRAGACEEIARVALGPGGSAAPARAAVAAIRRRRDLRGAEVVACLPHDRVLRREVALPLAARENLREVLGFEMDRHTPFATADVYFDWRVLEMDEPGKRILVDLAAAPRATVDRSLAALKAWGLPPDATGVLGPQAERSEPFDLLPPEARPRRRAVRHRLTVGLALVAASLAVAAVRLDIAGQQRLLEAYDAEIARSRAAGLEADGMRTQLAALSERGRHVVERKRTRPSLVALLDAVTRLLPDDTWLSQFRVQGDQLILSGYAPTASKLIATLEDSPALSQVRFTSPVTVDPKLGVERFNLAAFIAAPEKEP